MPFRVVSGIGQRTSVLDGGVDRSRGSGNFEHDLGCLVVTNRKFVAYLCKSAEAIKLQLGW